MTRRSGPRLLRAAVPLLAALLALLLTAQSALAAVSWSATTTASPAYGWAVAPSLARTVATDGTTWIHTVSTSDRIGTTFVSDTGPYAGVMVRRAAGTSGTFGAATRVNPGDEHGLNAVIAAADGHVYVAWLHQDHYVAGDLDEDRTIRFRANSDHGASASWADIVDLTTAGRSAKVSIAASGASVYVAWTDADTGDIKLAVSGDHGATWAPAVTLATTDLAPGPSGYGAGATVAASGSNVIVLWLMDGEIVRASVSTDGAATFPPATTVSPGPSWNLSAAAAGSRIAVAMTSEAGVQARIWTNGSWGPLRGVAPFGAGLTYKAPGYGTSIALYGTSGVAVAWAACRRADCSASARTGVDLRWRESANNGGKWAAPVTVASYAASASRRINNSPTILMPGAKKRYVTWNAWAADNGTYRVLYRRASGRP